MLKHTQEQYFEGAGVPDQGYYSFITLDDIITNYMVGYADDMNTSGQTPRHKVEFFAQRAIQEFSYDILSNKSWEIDVTDSLTFALPQDFVKEIQLSYVDTNGYERKMIRRRDSSDPLSPLQTEEGEFMFNNDGELLYRDSSVTRERYEGQNASSGDTSGRSYYNGYFYGDDYADSLYYQYGKRYGSEPEQMTINGSYIINREEGSVSFSGDTANQLVTVQYVTDGLAGVGTEVDYTKIRVPKLCEDAMYDLITYSLIKNRKDVPLYEKQLAKKTRAASMRNAKHRINEIEVRELIQTIRGKNKNIKR